MIDIFTLTAAASLVAGIALGSTSTWSLMMALRGREQHAIAPVASPAPAALVSEPATDSRTTISVGRRPTTTRAFIASFVNWHIAHVDLCRAIECSELSDYFAWHAADEGLELPPHSDLIATLAAWPGVRKTRRRFIDGETGQASRRTVVVIDIPELDRGEAKSSPAPRRAKAAVVPVELRLAA